MSDANIWNAGTVSVPAFTAPAAAEQNFVATAGQVNFTLTEFTYTLGIEALKVYVNGIRKDLTTDFLESTASSFSFTSPLNAGDKVKAEAYSVNISGITASEVTPQQVQNNSYISGTTTGNGSNYVLSLTPAITAYATNQVFLVTFHAASGGAPNISINGLVVKALSEETADGSIIPILSNRILAGKSYFIVYDGTRFKVLGLPYIPPVSLSFLRNAHQGFVLSTIGASSTITIGAGQCADSTNSVLIDLLASMSKTTAAWSVGSSQGGLDVGSAAINTWYHFYAIRRSDTGAIDIIFSLSGLSPTLPTGYTQYRWIGVWRTNASGLWESWVQVGDDIDYNNNVTVSSIGNIDWTARALLSLILPVNIRVLAKIKAGFYAQWTGAPTLRVVKFSDPSTTDTAAAFGQADLSSNTYAATEITQNSGTFYVRSNTSGQIGARTDATSTFTTLAAYGFNIAEAKGR